MNAASRIGRLASAMATALDGTPERYWDIAAISIYLDESVNGRGWDYVLDAEGAQQYALAAARLRLKTKKAA